ncbi:MAG: DUF3540 domain-containing protein [Cellvibrionaceae bacterium]|nr:DUF3540 domain-containing protein [Cellvibrionaceae bacterium]
MKQTLSTQTLSTQNGSQPQRRRLGTAVAAEALSVTETTPVTETPATVSTYSARVIAIHSDADNTETDNTATDNSWHYQLMINGVEQTAVAAEALLVRPEVGDLVLCVYCEKTFFVSQLLQRQKAAAKVLIHSSRPVEWVAPSLCFKALDELELLSARKLTLSARDLIAGATRTLIQQAHHLIQHATSYSLTTKGLMKLSGRQQLIVAEDDLRMDAKRINMG